MKGEGRGLGIHFPTFLNLNHPRQCFKKSPMENNEVTLFRCLKKKKKKRWGIEKNESKYINFKLSISSVIGLKTRFYVTLMTSSPKEPFFSVFFLFVLVSFLVHATNLWKSL